MYGALKTLALGCVALAISGCDDLRGDQGMGEAFTEVVESDAALDVSDEEFLSVTRCMAAKARLGRIFSAVAKIEEDPTRKTEISGFAQAAEKDSDEFEQLLVNMLDQRPLTRDQVNEFGGTIRQELDALEEGSEIDEFGAAFARIGDKCDEDYVTAE